MAGPAQLLTTVLCAIALSLAAGACTDGEDDLGVLVDPAPGSTSSTTTTSTVAPTTTTTSEPTTTTLSEQAQAEADVTQLVTDYWFAPFDTSKNEYGAQYLTGLIAERSREFAESKTADGQAAREIGQQTLEVRRVELDLEAGDGEVEVCVGSFVEVIDLETEEQLVVEDPTYLTVSVYLVEQTAAGWRIAELFSSQASENPQLCEVSNDG